MKNWFSVEEKLPDYEKPCWVKGNPYANKPTQWALAVLSCDGWYSIDTTFGWIGDAEEMDWADANHMDDLSGVTHWLPAEDKINEDLYNALKAAMEFIDANVGDPDLADEMVEAWSRLQDAKPHEALAQARGES